jgi:phosphoenolpyruvate carboxykinase (GTP)
MAMLPVCGYHMGDYFAHWLKIGRQTDPGKLPKIFYVNWFRKDSEGGFLWPGFGENSRVLKWVFERLDDKAGYVETPLGRMPTAEAIDTTGLDLSQEALDQLLKVEVEGWLNEIPGIEEHYAQFGDRLPQELREELEQLKDRLQRA